MSGKERLSASVDAGLVQAGREAVASGRAESLSAWVSEALRLKVEHDQRLQALDRFLADFEGEHGPISPEDIEAAVRRARARATVVRPPAPGQGPAAAVDAAL